MMNREEITYYPEHDFNGVLFILREPRGDSKKSMDETTVGNRAWYICMASDPQDHLQRQYHNRFTEMLRVVRRDDLLRSAFGNTKKTGGGKNASNEYRKMTADEKRARIIEMVDASQPTFVFLPRELYRIIAGSAVEETGGVTYMRGEQFRKCVYQGVTFYEIYHPAFRRRIDCDRSE